MALLVSVGSGSSLGGSSGQVLARAGMSGVVVSKV